MRKNIRHGIHPLTADIVAAKCCTVAKSSAPPPKPQLLPMPPIIIATTPYSNQRKPSIGRISLSKAMRIRATATSAEPMANAHKITRSEGMPTILLHSGLHAEHRDRILQYDDITSKCLVAIYLFPALLIKSISEL